jgi:predicted AAA+ superfamily ATPase
MLGKAIVIHGPRRVGKTTLLEKYLETVRDEEVLFVKGDDIVTREYLESQSIEYFDILICYRFFFSETFSFEPCLPG